MLLAYWVSLAFLVYTFGGYAVCVWALCKLRSKSIRRGDITPSITVLIAIRGDNPSVIQRLDNILEQDYPQDKMEILIVWDGPSHEGELRVRPYLNRGLRTISTEGGGKNHALRAGIAASSGEIIVFTDVGVRMDSGAIRMLASNFADPSVGCVTSEDDTLAARGNAEPAFVSFESLLRRLESRFYSAIGASGSLFAARRSVCSAWPERLSSDFFVPLQAIEAGQICTVDHRVKGYIPAVKAKSEFHRKVRTIVHGIDVLFTFRRLLNPLQYGFAAWQLTSHKLFRWLLPAGFGLLFLSNLFLWQDSLLYRITLLCQCVLYSLGILPWISSRFSSLRVCTLCHFFVVGNLATIKAWIEYFQGERYAVWKPSARA